MFQRILNKKKKLKKPLTFLAVILRNMKKSYWHLILLSEIMYKQQFKVFHLFFLFSTLCHNLYDLSDFSNKNKLDALLKNHEEGIMAFQ